MLPYCDDKSVDTGFDDFVPGPAHICGGDVSDQSCFSLQALLLSGPYVADLIMSTIYNCFNSICFVLCNFCFLLRTLVACRVAEAAAIS